MTTKTASALLKEQTSVNTQDNVQSSSENILRYVTIEGSPFTTILLENGRWGLVMGDQLVSDQTFEDVDEAAEFVETRPWSLIMTAAYIYTDYINKNINNLKTEKDVK